MPSSQLPNYLRSQRKLIAFSQEEVAFLLGAQTGAKVSRYEKFVHIPSLETALAFEAIFQRPVRELFAGLYQQAAQGVGARAKELAQKTGQRKTRKSTARKLQTLTAIITSEVNKSVQLS